MMSKFYNDVYEVVRLIPPGRATSYGAIARYLGAIRSSRMVGYAMNLAHSVIPSVPAHRVVNRNGLLTWKMHFNPPEAMEQLLQDEGIIVRDDAIQDWDNVFWDPSENLRL